MTALPLDSVCMCSSGNMIEEVDEELDQLLRVELLGPQMLSAAAVWSPMLGALPLGAAARDVLLQVVTRSATQWLRKAFTLCRSLAWGRL